MVTWSEWPLQDQGQKWDETMLTASDQSVFQSYRWGEHKRQHGWVPLRLAARDKNGRLLAMAQLLAKHYAFGTCVCWVPGGPVLGFSSDIQRLSDIVVDLRRLLQQRFRLAYVRLQPNTLRSAPRVYEMLRAGFRRPPARLSTSFTVINRMGLSTSDLLANMTSKHRYYTKKARTAGLNWEVSSSAGAIHALAQLNMEVARRTRVGWMASSEQTVQHLSLAMQDQSFILTGRSGANPVCSCLTLLSGSRAFYMMAGANAAGRILSASYAMFEQLAFVLESRGITELDFGGIDPKTPGAQGVNHFKLGFGGEIAEHLGEWEWFNSRLLGSAVNIAVGRTMRRS